MDESKIAVFDKNKFNKILLDTMKAFIRLCDQYNFQYFGCGGTVIGAVRHHGLIPWDDDIDVYMPRKDYDRFINLKENLKGSNYGICTIDDENYYLPYAKFYDTNTTIWETEDFSFVIGVYIDIFPLDMCDYDIDEIRTMRSSYNSLIREYKQSVRYYTFDTLLSFCKEKNYRKVAYYIRKFIINKCLIGPNYYRKRIHEFENGLKKREGDYLFHIYFTYDVEKEIFKKDWFKDYIEMPFEDFKIRIPKGYKEYLTQLFGDYMTPPPIEMQKSHHYHYFVGLDRKYTIEEIKEIKRNR